MQQPQQGLSKDFLHFLLTKMFHVLVLQEIEKFNFGGGIGGIRSEHDPVGAILGYRFNNLNIDN